MRPSWRNVGLWLLTALVSFSFLQSGLRRFLDPVLAREEFTHWGYPAWFAFVVAGFEVLAGTLVLWPRAAFGAAIALAMLMLGATATHLWTPGESGMVSVTLTLLALAAGVAWMRRPARLRTASEREADAPEEILTAR